MGSSISKTEASSSNRTDADIDTTQLSGEEYEILQQVQSMEGMPKYRRPETFQEKAFRKVR